MPPEPLPCDHRKKDDNKYERNNGSPSAGTWRGFGTPPPQHHHHHNHDDEQSPGLQGLSKHGYQLFHEESGHGSLPSQPSTNLQMLQGESCRLSASQADRKYLRHSRDNKAGEIVSKFGQRDWKDYQWEGGNACLHSSDSHRHGSTAQRPSDDLVAYPSHFLSDVENSWDQVLFKDQQDKMNVEGLATGHLSDLNFARFAEKDTESPINRVGSFCSDNHIGENQCYAHDHSLRSIAWKPLKWARSSSLSSRTSVLSPTASSKSVKAEFDDGPELPGKVTPVQSPAGDGAVGVTSSLSFEDTFPRKKQRLGWGQGLAKYEKKKVEGPEETYSKSESVHCANPKTAHIQVPSLPEGSPKLVGILGCTSPATPSSVACSSSPGVEEKPYIKVANNVSNISNFSDSPGHAYQGCAEEFSANIKHFELNPRSCINSLLVDLLQPEDPCFGDSNSGRSTSLNKLLSLKIDILKALEKTECEIDSFESELKALNSEPEINGPRTVTSQPFREADGASKVIQESRYLHDFVHVPSPALVEPSLPVGHEPLEVSVEVKDMELNLSECVRFKHSEPDMLKSGDCTADVGAETIAGLEGTHIASTMDGKRSEAVGKGDLGNCLILHKSKPDGGSCSGGMRVPCEPDDALTSLILTSNKNSARRAFEAFDKLLPTDLPKCNSGGTDNVSCRGDESHEIHVLKKLAVRKSFLRFKERILTLKFRAFHHLWKEDMRLLSMRKYRAKSHKRIESSTRPSQSGFQKHRSSIRSRFTSPAGNLTLVPTTEMMDFTSKLLSDSHTKIYRDTLKMPALVSDEIERRHLRFISSNGLVEDPCAVEKERAMINPWSSEEKEVFMEMLASFGKDFSKIASFLIHKTTGDCIEFYYKNHKSESFEKIKKRLELRKQGSCFPVNTYLVTSGKKWHQCEANVASLDMLGAASIVAAHAEESVKTHQTYGRRSILGGYFDPKLFQAVDGVIERTSGAEKNEREAAAADVLASICGPLSSEAMGSCITSSIDPDEWKYQKRFSISRMDRPVTPEITHNFDEDDACSDESCGEVGPPLDWTDEEKSVFIGALRDYGRDFTSISHCVGTRTQNQCKIFFSKGRKCLGLDGIHQALGNEGTPTSDAHGGSSDTEDACVLEMGSATCSTRSCSKVDLEQHINRSSRDYEQSGNDIATTDVDESSGMDDKMSRSDQVGNPIGDDTQLDLVDKEVDFNGSDKVVSRAETQRDTTPEVVGDAVLISNVPTWFSEELGPSVDIETKDQETEWLVTPSESVCVEEEFRQSRSDFPVKVKQDIEAGSSDESLKPEQDRIKVPVRHLPETEPDDREDAKSNRLGVKEISTFSFPYSSSSSNGSHISGFSFVSNHLAQVPRQSPLQKSNIISCQQQQEKRVVLLPDPCLSPFYDGHLNPQDHRNKQLKSVATDFYQQFLTGHQSLNPQFDQQGLDILSGFPLEVLSKKEGVNGTADSIREKPAVIQSFSNSSQSSSQSSKFFVPELCQENRDGVAKPQHSASELLFLPKTSKRPDDPLKSILQIPGRPSRSCESAEQSLVKTGDIKLFGKILAHTSPMQKSTIAEGNNEKSVSLGLSNQVSASKFSSELRADGASVVGTKLELPGSYLGLKELSKGSFGFLDGNRIQTAGLLSLPDSNMSKYTAYDDKYRADQQSVVKRNEHHWNLGLPVFPTKEACNSSAPMYYPAAYGSYKQPVAMDANEVDAFAELQKWKGQQIMMTGFPCASQGGVVTMGRDGGGVSDPVAAIKKHYAEGRQAGIRKGDISREGERKMEGMSSSGH